MGRLKENSPTSPIGGLALNRFWLARWLRERDVEAYVIYPSSIAVSREHRRAKTDRLDTELLMRAFLG
jgi:transposase